MNSSITFRLQNQYQQVLRLIGSLDNAFILRNHKPGKWSIKENMAHLGRYHEIFRHRIESILAMDKPEFGRYKAENDPDFLAWKALEVSLITEKTSQIRSEITKELETLHSDYLKRQGKHPKLGFLSVEEWIEFFLLHESHHIYTIFWMINEFKPKH